MMREDKLIILKQDLQLLTSANDEYLLYLLEFSKDLMAREGVSYKAGDLECDMVNIHYAAYLFRKRGGQETAMPRFLRWELNNLLFSQKGKTNDDV